MGRSVSGRAKIRPLPPSGEGCQGGAETVAALLPQSRSGGKAASGEAVRGCGCGCGGGGGGGGGGSDLERRSCGSESAVEVSCGDGEADGGAPDGGEAVGGEAVGGVCVSSVATVAAIAASRQSDSVAAVPTCPRSMSASASASATRSCVARRVRRRGCALVNGIPLACAVLGRAAAPQQRVQALW